MCVGFGWVGCACGVCVCVFFCSLILARNHENEHTDGQQSTVHNIEGLAPDKKRMNTLHFNLYLCSSTSCGAEIASGAYIMPKQHPWTSSKKQRQYTTQTPMMPPLLHRPIPMQGTITKKNADAIYKATGCFPKLKKFKPGRPRELKIWSWYPHMLPAAHQFVLQCVALNGKDGGRKTKEQQSLQREIDRVARETWGTESTRMGWHTTHFADQLNALDTMVTHEKDHCPDVGSAWSASEPRSSHEAANVIETVKVENDIIEPVKVENDIIEPMKDEKEIMGPQKIETPVKPIPIKPKKKLPAPPASIQESRECAAMSCEDKRMISSASKVEMYWGKELPFKQPPPKKRRLDLTHCSG